MQTAALKGLTACLLLLALRLDAVGPVTALAFSPDGLHLASVRGRNVRIHTPDSNAPPIEIATGLPRIGALAFRADGRRLAIAGGAPGANGAVLWCDFPSGRELARLAFPGDIVPALALDADGRRLAVATGADVKILDAEPLAPEVRFELRGHSGQILAVAFSPDSRFVVTAGRDRSVKVWSADDRRLLRSFSHHTEAVNTAVFRPAALGADASGVPFACATGSDDHTVRIWQPAIGRMVRIVRHHAGAILTLAYAPDGRRLFSAGSEGILRAIDADSDDVLVQWPASNEWIYSLAVRPDGRLVACGDWSGRISLWTPTGEPMGALP